MKCGASLGEEDLISTVKQRRHRKLVLPAPASGGHLSYRIDLGETIECQIWAISSSSSLKCMQVAYMYSSANCSTIWRGRVKEVTARSMASCVCVRVCTVILVTCQHQVGYSVLETCSRASRLKIGRAFSLYTSPVGTFQMACTKPS